MQLQLLPDAIDDKVEQLHDRHRAKAWQELIACCRIIGRYRNVYQNDYYYRRLREAADILALMTENIQRVKLARRVFDNGNYTDALKVLKAVVW